MSLCAPLDMSLVIAGLEARVSRLEQALPPVPPPAAEPAHPPAQEPADDAVEGPGVVCSPAGWQRAVMLRDELDRALRRYDYGKLSDADLGIELLRISNQLATESKRLRSAPPSAPEMPLLKTPGSFTPAESKPLASEAESPTVGAELSLRAAEVTPSGGAEALPSGWQRTHHGMRFTHESGAFVAVDTRGGFFAWPVDGRDGSRHDTAPQAMCAALGIELHDDGLCVARLRGEALTQLHGGSARVDACASAALEAFHARQQAAAIRQEADELRKAARELTAPMRRPDDACSCPYHADGHRVVSRYCDLHGAAWQTLAEQRSELHEDGTPRAGCGYCGSTRELDARERGLR